MYFVSKHRKHRKNRVFEKYKFVRNVVFQIPESTHKV